MKPDSENAASRSAGDETPGRRPVRGMRIAAALTLAVLAGGAIVFALRRGEKPLPSAVLDHVKRIEPAPGDPDLAVYNALAYHLYALKADVGQFEMARGNLAQLAIPATMAPGVREAHGALLDLCREIERFFVDRRELDLVRRSGRRENLSRTASSLGGLTIGSAAKFAIAGVDPLGLALAGGVAVSHAAGHLIKREAVEEEYQAAAARARVTLNDQIARAEHALTNLRAALEAERGWRNADVFAEASFAAYADGLAAFAQGEWDAALARLSPIAELAGMDEARFYAGLAWRAKGDNERAAAQMLDAIRRMPPQFLYAREILAAAHYHLARIRIEQKMWADAIAHANAALEISGEKPDFRILRGEALLAAGSAAQAREDFERALALENESTRAAYGLAESLALGGRSEEALDYLEAAASQGRINLSEALENPSLMSLRDIPRFHALTSLSIGRRIDWGPISDNAVIINENSFPLTNIALVVRRKNAGEASERSVTTERLRLEPGEAIVVAGAIARGPKTRTEYFAYELECDQGVWTAKDYVALMDAP